MLNSKRDIFILFFLYSHNLSFHNLNLCFDSREQGYCEMFLKVFNKLLVGHVLSGLKPLSILLWDKT